MSDQNDSGASDYEESIRDDLAQTTFEELLGMRDKLGTKIYRDSVLKKFAKPKDAGEEDDQDDDDDDESDSEDEEDDIPVSQRINSKTTKRTFADKSSQFKRLNKNCPIESSSKRLDNRHNFAIVLPTSTTKSTESTFRDPRFDSQCGQFREDKFEKNYQFLTDMKRKELDTLKKQLKRAKSDEARAKFTKAIQVLKSQLRNELHKEKQRNVEKKVKNNLAKELNLDATTAVPAPKAKPETRTQAKNQKPQVFVNKATMKRAQLVEKFKELKKAGKLDKYLERKRKKNAGKERKHFERKF